MKTQLKHIFIVALLLFTGMAYAQVEGERKAGDRMTLTIKNVEYAFRWCPPGTFMMGSPADEAERDANETQHQVTLTRGFWMLETPVTQTMWQGVMGNNPSMSKGAKLPVAMVTWDDCQAYIKKLNDSGIAPAGFKFSLPTEAQWEYACRAGTTTAYYFGSTLSKQQAHFDERQTKEVGSYPANAWGLRDTHGNVWEWCLDWFGDYPDSVVTDPVGPSQGIYYMEDLSLNPRLVTKPTLTLDRPFQDPVRVFRGGTYSMDAGYCRSASRGFGVPAFGAPCFGLRLALIPDGQAVPQVAAPPASQQP